MRTLVRLWNEGGVDAYLAEASPDLTFTPDPRFPEQGPFSGDELRTFMEQWQEAWGGSTELLLDQVAEHSDAVLARCRWVISGASSGAFVPAVFTFVGWFGDGGELETLLAFFDHQHAIDAAERGRAGV